MPRLDQSALRALESRLGAHRLERDVPLAPLTTFRIGGPADLLYRAQGGDDLAEAVLTARDLGIPHFLLGAGANVLVGDGGYRGLIIQSSGGAIDFLDDVTVRAEAGVLTYHDLIEATVARAGQIVISEATSRSMRPDRAASVFSVEGMSSTSTVPGHGFTSRLSSGYDLRRG